jgi:hypothetical protein
MPPDTDVEWCALLMWAALGAVAGAVLLVSALVGLATQLKVKKEK